MRPLNSLSRWSSLSRVPDSIAAVTQTGREATDSEVGLKRGTRAALWRRVEALYRTGVQPGLQLCVRHHGQVVLNRSLGYARGNEPHSRELLPVPMRIDTPINLFSAGKAVSAMLMHKLEEIGALRINDRVADHIPGFERHGKGGITLRQVLTHRAGLARLPRTLSKDSDLNALLHPDFILEMMLDAHPEKIGGAPAYHAISGGFIFAEVMRRATGEEPRTLLEKYIKQPLGARWLDFGVSEKDVELVAANAYTGFLPQPLRWHLGQVVGAPFDQAVEASNDPGFLKAIVPSGNVIATAADVAHFYQCLLDDGRWEGNSVFAPDTVRKALVPDLTSATIDRVIGIPLRYSAGFMLGHGGIGLYGWNQRHTFGHLGLSSTFTWSRRDTGTVVAFITTGKPVLGPHMLELLALLSGFNALAENRLV